MCLYPKTKRHHLGVVFYDVIQNVISGHMNILLLCPKANFLKVWSESG